MAVNWIFLGKFSYDLDAIDTEGFTAPINFSSKFVKIEFSSNLARIRSWRKAGYISQIFQSPDLNFPRINPNIFLAIGNQVVTLDQDFTPYRLRFFPVPWLFTGSLSFSERREQL